MDKLKEYLLRHKADLEVDSPASDTWEYIGSKIPEESDQTGFGTKPGFSAWVIRSAVAACVIALAGAGLWWVSGTVKREPAPGVSATRVPAPEKIENAIRKEEKSNDEEKAVAKDIARNTSKPKQVRRKARPQKPAGLSDQTDIIDKSYSSLINYQLRKLRATPLYAESGSYFSFYVEQFRQMDHDEQEVKNDIKMYGLTTEFLEQLINVYQEKLTVLKNLQTEINKMNNKVREKQVPSEKAEVHYLDI